MPPRKPADQALDVITSGEGTNPPSRSSYAAPCLAALELVAAAFCDLPDQVIAAWMVPFFHHLIPVDPDQEIPARVADLAALIGIPLVAAGD